MEHRNYRSIFTFIISMLLVCALCLPAFAEGTAAGTENTAAAAEEKDEIAAMAEGIMEHHLWGFFTHWAEGDVGTMARISSFDWKKGKEDP